VAGMQDQLLMCSFRLPKLSPLQELRGVSCSTEPACKVDGDDDGNTLNYKIFSNVL
jgi:hypothetical protein